MEGLILGIDLCDDYSQISCFSSRMTEPEPVYYQPEDENKKENVLIPMVVCKKKGKDEWLIGEEACRTALFNDGTTVDKLVKMIHDDKFATIEGVRYSAGELMRRYLEKLLLLPKAQYGTDEIRSVVFTVQTLDGRFIDCLVRTAEACGIDRSAVHVVSHTESFVYHTISQKKDVWANLTSLFDLTDEGLHYYEMKVIRGCVPQMIEASHEKMQEGFRLDVLDNPNGARLGDTILTSCADRMLHKKVVSAVLLSGRVFPSIDWAPDFKKAVCTRRKVYYVPQIFAIGAAYLAYDALQETSAYPFICSCEGRISSTVSLQAVYEGRKEQVILASAGSNWYEARSSIDLIPDDMEELEFTITPAGSRRVEKVNISLAELPKRPNKTTRIEVIVSFTSEKCMTVRVVDLGFGDLYPASDTVIRRDIYI